MFAKLVMDNTAGVNSTNHYAFMSDLSNIILGNITTTAGLTSEYFNVPNCTITGAADSSIYSNVTFGSSYFQFAKKHHGDKTGFTPSTRVNFDWYYGYSPSVRTLTSNGTNWFPSSGSRATSGTRYWFTQNIGGSLTNSPTNYTKIMIASSAYWTIIQLTYSTDNVATFALFDYEATAADEYAFSNVNALISPQVAFGDYVYNMSEDVNDTSDRPLLGRSYYMSKGGIAVNGNSDTATPDDIIGAGSPGGNTSFEFFPPMRATIAPQPLVGGDGHLLQPVYVFSSGDERDIAGVPAGMGKIPYFYRTTDNLSQPGDIITMGADQYVSFPFHKTGGSNSTDTALDIAHYLVPVTIGGV